MADYKLRKSETSDLKNIYNPEILHPSLGLGTPGVVQPRRPQKSLTP